MKYILIILNFFIITFSSSACSFKYIGGFAYANQLADIVVKGEVLKENYGEKINGEPYMNIKIHKTFRGYSIQKIIRVFGDNGAACRPYLGKFKPGEEWVFALNLMDDDYEILICGELTLKVENEIVIGKIFGYNYNEKETTISLEEIDKVIISPFLYPIKRRCYPKINKGEYFPIFYNTFSNSSCTAEYINNVVNSELSYEGLLSSLDYRLLLHVNVNFDVNGKIKSICIPNFSENKNIIELSPYIYQIFENKLNCYVTPTYQKMRNQPWVSFPILLSKKSF